jgi:hypothetical protein
MQWDFWRDFARARGTFLGKSLLLIFLREVPLGSAIFREFFSEKRLELKIFKA